MTPTYFEKKTFLSHTPVLVSEIVSNLKPESKKSYLDCTFGAGGHTKAILDSANCFVKAIDQDPNVNKYAAKFYKEYEKRFEFVQGNFSKIKQFSGGKQYDGLIADLGVSSMQLDEKDRGFSFMHDSNLNMRMNNEGYSAEDFIAYADEKEIADVIYKYGEEVESRKIAKMIVKERQKEKIRSTLKLANIIRKCIPYRRKTDPATKTFQAIRIFINKELENLEALLATLEDILNPGAKILIISFHSLEDSIVKSFLRKNALKKISRSKYSLNLENYEHENRWLKIISKKPIVPSIEEVKENYRSRSARLRVFEKI